MVDTLTPSRLAEIEALAKKAIENNRLLDGLNPHVVVAILSEVTALRAWNYEIQFVVDHMKAELASHAALQAEVERLRAHVEATELAVKTCRERRLDAVAKLTTARESAAREMREGCLEELRGELMVAQSCLAASGRINNTEYVNGWEARIMALHEAIKAIAALPLTPTKEPADG